MEGQSIKLIATVKSRRELKQWKSKSTSGTLLGGVLSDESANIDFVSWNEAAVTFDNILISGSTYEINHVRITTANSRFSKSNHACQLVFDKNTTFQVLTREPLIAPINITPIAELIKVDDQHKCCVFGTITSMSPPEVLPNMKIQKSFLRDSTGIIQVSLIGEKQIRSCNFCVGDTVLFENTILRVFGPLRCLQGYYGTRQVNPVDRNYTNFLHHPGQPVGLDLSPARLPPTSHTLETLNDSSGRKIFSATILAVHLSSAVYDKCPRFQCNSRILELESGLFRCSKCGADYHVASKGLALNIEVGDARAVPTSHKKLIMFNITAQQFLNGLTVDSIAAISEEESASLVSTLVGKRYSFTVNPGRQKGQFICDSFTKLSPSGICDTLTPSEESLLPYVASKVTPTRRTVPLPALSQLRPQQFTACSADLPVQSSSTFSSSSKHSTYGYNTCLPDISSFEDASQQPLPTLPRSDPLVPHLYGQQFISRSDYVSFGSNPSVSTSSSSCTPRLPTLHPSVSTNQDTTNLPCQRELFPIVSGQVQTENPSPMDLTKSQKRKFDMDYLLGNK